MRSLLTVGVVAAGLVALFALRVAIGSYLGEISDFRRSRSAGISRHPEQTGVAGLHEVSFLGPEGLSLAGWYAPARNRAAVVLVHGTQGDRSSLLPETRLLAQAGFGVLAFDLPGQGASDGRTFWGRGERQAIEAAVHWLAGRDDVERGRIGGFGLSLGGYVLAQAAAVEPELQAVVLAATPTDIVDETRLASSKWGFLSEMPALWALRRSGMPLDQRPIDLIGAISPREVFVIGGELDGWVPQRTVRALYEAAREPKSYWIVPGAGHGDFASAQPQDYATRLVAFFSRTLLQDP